MLYRAPFCDYFLRYFANCDRWINNPSVSGSMILIRI